MAIIKNLAFYQKSKLKNLIQYAAPTSFLQGYLPYPLDFINHMLPLILKFWQEAFVALENNDVLGLISFEKEKGNPMRLRLTKLFLESDSTIEGVQLVDYVISRYCAMGANSFQIVIDERHKPLIDLLVNNCKFNISSSENIFKIENVKKASYNGNFFEKFDNSMADEINELYNEEIHSHLRPIFSKNPDYFKDRFFSNNTSFKLL